MSEGLDLLFRSFGPAYDALADRHRAAQAEEQRAVVEVWRAIGEEVRRYEARAVAAEARVKAAEEALAAAQAEAARGPVRCAECAMQHLSRIKPSWAKNLSAKCAGKEK